MKVTYYFVFLCLQFLIAMTLLLGLLYIRKIRQFFFRLLTRLQLADSAPLKLIFWVVFLIIFFVMADAAFGYYGKLSIHEGTRSIIGRDRGQEGGQLQGYQDAPD